MNKLFRVLFVGAYIPYAILLSYYLTRLYLSYFLIQAVFLASSFAAISHKTYFDKSVLAWVRVKRVFELLMLISFSVRSFYRNQIITLCAVVGFFFVAMRLPKKYQNKCENPAIYVTFCMIFVTNADVIGKVCSILQCILILYEPHAKQITTASFEWAIERRLRQYHTVRLLQVYLFFFIEYSLTRMNLMALIIIIVGVGLYNAYACMTLDMDSEVKVNEYYLKADNLPKMYPLPLDILDAIRSCDIAKTVFKSHEI